MEVNFQILFSTCIIVLQIISITVIATGFRILQQTIEDSSKQKISAIESHSRREQKTGGGSRAEKHAGAETKRTDHLYPVPDEEGLLFIERIKLDKKYPVTGVNITANKKKK